MKSGAKGAENFFEHYNWSIFFPPNIWHMMTFLNPLDALIPKIPLSFFANFWVWVTSEARGSDSVGFWGPVNFALFGEGGSGRRALSIPPPPRKRKPGLPCFGGLYWLVASKEIHFSMCYAEKFVFRNFRLFLHCCELHVQPWLFGMQLAAVCMSAYGPVLQCLHPPTKGHLGVERCAL